MRQPKVSDSMTVPRYDCHNDKIVIVLNEVQILWYQTIVSSLIPSISIQEIHCRLCMSTALSFPTAHLAGWSELITSCTVLFFFSYNCLIFLLFAFVSWWLQNAVVDTKNKKSAEITITIVSRLSLTPKMVMKKNPS